MSLKGLEMGLEGVEWGHRGLEIGPEGRQEISTRKDFSTLGWRGGLCFLGIVALVAFYILILNYKHISFII